jgi:hypothetical protein
VRRSLLPRVALLCFRRQVYTFSLEINAKGLHSVVVYCIYYLSALYSMLK